MPLIMLMRTFDTTPEPRPETWLVRALLSRLTLISMDRTIRPLRL